MECYSCHAISGLHFVINTPIDAVGRGDRFITMCCQDHLGEIPSSILASDPKETIKRFVAMRDFAMIQGCQPMDKNNACTKCMFYSKGNWSFSTQVTFVNLSVYPSPCQCRCSYCDWRKLPCNALDYIKKNADSISKAYEKLFDTLKLAKKIELVIPQKTDWQVSCGEITIHPHKKEILDLTRGEFVSYFTNAFIFDEDIARELHDNPLASINLSIDSGTPETWHKVKGVDNFNHVLDNLRAYRKASQRAGQITLKYIICPDLNTSNEDFLSFVNIAKSLDVQKVQFSRDYADSPTASSSNDYGDSFAAFVESAARLLAFCKFNRITPYKFLRYTRQEVQTIHYLANKILSIV